VVNVGSVGIAVAMYRRVQVVIGITHAEEQDRKSTGGAMRSGWARKIE
jgi:hypothetical protein